MSTPEVVLLAGASGFLGAPLAAELRAKGVQVRRLVRRGVQERDEVSWDPARGRLEPQALDGVTCVVVLSGAGVAERRWTAARRRVLLESRTRPLGLVARRMADAAPSGPRRLVVASAVGYYGDRGEKTLTEDSPPGAGFLADLCVAWERAADPAREAGIAVVHARTGLVLDPGGGALGRLLPLVRLGLAGPLGSGRQWWPWITLEDEVAALVHLVGSGLTGPVNLTAPEPERNRSIVRELASALHRPAVLRVPGWALRCALGGFGGELAASQRAVPRALLADGFRFSSPTLADAVARLLG